MKLIHALLFILLSYTLPVKAIKAIKADADFKQETLDLLDRYINDQDGNSKQELFNLIHEGNLFDAYGIIHHRNFITIYGDKLNKACSDISNGFERSCPDTPNGFDAANKSDYRSWACQFISFHLDDISEGKGKTPGREADKFSEVRDKFNFVYRDSHIDQSELDKPFTNIFDGLRAIKEEDAKYRPLLQKMHDNICFTSSYETDAKEKWKGALTLKQAGFVWKAVILDRSIRMRIKKELRLVKTRDKLGCRPSANPDFAEKSKEYDEINTQMRSLFKTGAITRERFGIISADDPGNAKDLKECSKAHEQMQMLSFIKNSKVSDENLRNTLRLTTHASITEEEFNTTFPKD